MDDVPVIDDMAVLAAGMRSAAPQHHQRGGTEKAFEPIVVKPHAQPMADQTGRHRIKDLSQDEPAARRDGDDGLFVIRRPARRQHLQCRALEIKPLSQSRIAPPNDLIDKASIGAERVEVARATQQQGIFDCLLEMAVRAFD